MIGIIAKYKAYLDSSLKKILLLHILKSVVHIARHGIFLEISAKGVPLYFIHICGTGVAGFL